ncbi:hypothetical protein GCM10010964_40580 [Caldovatus sediminis]|uniref:DUF3574 domain-containing protein n=1 Tax=Caldovatus sediminis TaxID=2041189 RepID=A0A8J3EDZ2_9PROT|nr:DUF3574 domain-containing protein [Caldovatus sediminis]GGG49126.1 hypothetical protein GCM10010964_40580 [Caldovatus sediminis]
MTGRGGAAPRGILVVAAAALLGGCAAPPPVAAAGCPEGARAATVLEAYFGRSGPAEAPRVSEAAFARFLAEEVTPRFPEGLTVLDGLGHWRSPATGRIARERSKVLVLVLPETDEAAARARLAPATAAYGQRFRQESVLVVTRTACASF